MHVGWGEITAAALTCVFESGRSSWSWSAESGTTCLWTWPSRWPRPSAPCRMAKTQNQHHLWTTAQVSNDFWVEHCVCVCVSVPPVLLVQVNQDVHVLLGHQPVGGADVMILQHWPVVVQYGHLRPDTQTTLKWGAAAWTWPSRQQQGSSAMSLFRSSLPCVDVEVVGRSCMFKVVNRCRKHHCKDLQLT